MKFLLTLIAIGIYAVLSLVLLYGIAPALLVSQSVPLVILGWAIPFVWLFGSIAIAAWQVNKLIEYRKEKSEEYHS